MMVGVNAYSKSINVLLVNSGGPRISTQGSRSKKFNMEFGKNNKLIGQFSK